MNSTTTINTESIDNIFIYVMLGFELLNSIVGVWTSYKLGHLNLNIEHLECCCLEFDNLNIQTDSDGEIQKPR